MAFTAQLIDVGRSGEQITLTVTYADSATAYTMNREFSYDSDTITKNQIIADVTALGSVLKGRIGSNSLTFSQLKGAIGTIITI